MSVAAAIAQCLWATGNVPSAVRFARALGNPEGVQERWLQRRLRVDAESEFGREHDFAGICNRRDFVRRVPLRDWQEHAGWIERIRGGGQGVLTSERVGHLAPTSGSSGARKLIPFNASLHRAFACAVGAWMWDLIRLEPGILGGPAYWSISPLAQVEEGVQGGVPVGFAEDADYLGGWKARLTRLLMAVPSGIRHERNPEVFWRRTASLLLERRDLRLISVWHPSFLDLIVDAARRHWDGILDGLSAPRARDLRAAGEDNPGGWWPSLRVISAWGDLAAEPGLREVARRFPRCRVQAKGLLATEAVVTIPWRGGYPLAVTSHYFEFLTPGGDALAAHEVERGGTYEVVVTNGGGLWRYRLGDMVECTGFLGRTPTLRFLGRAGNTSDLCGEKLAEPFVAACLGELWPEGAGRPRVAFLRPWLSSGGGRGYFVVTDEVLGEEVIGRLDALLRRNPHYDLARRLGQLEPLRIGVEPNAGFPGRPNDLRRLGDVKPMVLDSVVSEGGAGEGCVEEKVNKN